MRSGALLIGMRSMQQVMFDSAQPLVNSHRAMTQSPNT
jgi:hypothetical protein